MHLYGRILSLRSKRNSGRIRRARSREGPRDVCATPIATPTLRAFDDLHLHHLLHLLQNVLRVRNLFHSRFPIRPLPPPPHRRSSRRSLRHRHMCRSRLRDIRRRGETELLRHLFLPLLRCHMFRFAALCSALCLMAF